VRQASREALGMKRLLAILGAAAIAATLIVTPAAATTTRIAIHCDETRVSRSR